MFAVLLESKRIALSVTFLQSTEALEFMKRDLAEFTQVVQHDTACTIAATASVVKDKLAVSTAARELGFLSQKAKQGVNIVQGHDLLKKPQPWASGFRFSPQWGFVAEHCVGFPCCSDEEPLEMSTDKFPCLSFPCGTLAVSL